MLVNNHLGGTCSRTLSSCGRSPLDPQVGSINLFVHVAHFHVLMYFHRGLSFPAIFVVKGHQRPPSCKPASQTQRVTHQEHGLGGTKCLTTACGIWRCQSRLTACRIWEAIWNWLEASAKHFKTLRNALIWKANIQTHPYCSKRFIEACICCMHGYVGPLLSISQSLWGIGKYPARVLVQKPWLWKS